MESFKTVSSIVTPLDKVNVDTDQIVPKQFLKLVQKSGFGKFLFFNWRYDENENKKPDFVLNDPKYENSNILVAGDNFGCGSSREHAVWALLDYGFTVIIAPSFADIFYSNCFKNGILPITLDQELVEKLQQEDGAIKIDLEKCVGCGSCEPVCPFGLLEIVDDKVQLKEGCNLCGACQDACSYDAIIIEVIPRP